MSIIKEKGLSELEVWCIVREWYTEGMCLEMFVDEFGDELDELCDMAINNIKTYLERTN